MFVVILFCHLDLRLYRYVTVEQKLFRHFFSLDEQKKGNEVYTTLFSKAKLTSLSH
jgi:hypothetical protein